jgi:hypothetical protein
MLRLVPAGLLGLLRVAMVGSKAYIVYVKRSIIIILNLFNFKVTLILLRYEYAALDTRK